MPALDRSLLDCRYVDATADVQTAALLLAFVSPRRFKCEFQYKCLSFQFKMQNVGIALEK